MDATLIHLAAGSPPVRGPYLVGRTPVGRVTVAVLKINGPFRVEPREELIEEGLILPT